MATPEQQNQSASVRMVTVSEDQAGQRLDNFLMAQMRQLPRSRIYRIIRSGEVRVNRSRAKPGQRVQAGDQVRIPPVRLREATEPPRPGRDLAAKLRAATLYEDDSLIVIDKPSGMAVHGGSGISLGLVEALRAIYPDQRFLELVHRLDRDTSGCVMIAKRRRRLLDLHEQLRAGTLHKEYRALVVGSWPRRRHQVDAPLVKNVLKSGERMVRAGQGGKPSLTRFEVLGSGRLQAQPMTLLRAMPVTGRTHQIRVHCQVTGQPIAGDAKYGEDATNAKLKSAGLRRLFLHAFQLEIPDSETGRMVTVHAPLPADLEQFLRVCEIPE